MIVKRINGKRVLSLALAVLTLLLTVSVLGGCTSMKKPTINVLNYGQYMDEEVRSKFEEQYKCKINYEEFDDPEKMYAKYSPKAVNYDLICVSDYMIEKLRTENELLEIDYSNIPNYKNIGQKYKDLSKAFDPDNKFTIPYLFGTVGILYNKNIVSEASASSWNIIFSSEYEKKILMTDSIRDAFMIPMKLMGKSLNSKNKDDWKAAENKLIQQKPLVQAYVVDEAKDLMIAGNADLAVIYSSEALIAMQDNEDLAYSVPVEGSNVWVDSWCIPKTCQNKELAEKFLDFLCGKEAATLNFEYVGSGTPNEAVFEELEDEIKNNTATFPTDETLNNCEIFSYMGSDMEKYYSNLWKNIKASSEQ